MDGIGNVFGLLVGSGVAKNRQSNFAGSVFHGGKGNVLEKSAEKVPTKEGTQRTTKAVQAGVSDERVVNVLLVGIGDGGFGKGEQVKGEKFAQGAGEIDQAVDLGGGVGVDGDLVANLGSAG